MNQKIKELVDHIGTDSSGKWISIDNVEKLSELIIRECIKAASDPGDGLIKDDTWHDGVRACVWSIQDEFNFDRTFGVER
jgi:hypothetical protein